MTLRTGLAVWLLCALGLPAWGLDYKPYPKSEINTQQWWARYEQAQQELGAHAQEFPEQSLIVFGDKANGMQHTFTQPGHPAHPAWITRQVAMHDDGEVSIEQVGYYAGDEGAFAFLFESYLVLNDQIKADVTSRHHDEAKWAPSEKEKTAAEKTVTAFLKSLDKQKYKRAYNMLTADAQQTAPFDSWRQHHEQFYQRAGGEPAYSNIRVDWYKDPPDADLPGVYVVFALDCRYKNIDRCGQLVILHQQKNRTFRVTDHRRDIVDQAAAAQPE